ncbi:helix-turn-helix domain-containing protein [Halalkalibacter alkalisediminis]|uniref:Helix-turn-helix domain-containing protein n=1 Tax=Halalkalibacter alkalisediminis TaxID=935616 RepID=A0ABV6NKN3_9BACI|nr:helix-turn-helix domain-containing protein [Halalkalibacter alkalisediminis]
MKIKMAVFGSQDSFEQIKAYEHQLKNIEMVPYIYTDPRDTVNLIKKLEPCDILYFSGLLPYFYATLERQKLQIPAVYPSFNEHALTLSLFYIKQHHEIPMERLSIDLVDRSYLTNVLNDLQITPKHLHVKDYPTILGEQEGNFDLDEIEAFHTALWDQGKTSLALTSIHAIFNRLTEKGIPCLKMLDPQNSIIDSLKEAKTIVELQKRNRSQIAIGLITIDSSESSKPLSEEVLVIQNQLAEFAKIIQASIQMKDDCVKVFGTKGSIEDATSQFQSFPLLSDIEQETATGIHIGFGFGMTMKEAESNAEMALTYARKSSYKQSVFIMTEEKRIIGPLNEKKKEHNIQTENEERQTLAKALQISTANLDKVIQFVKTRDTSPFTSNDLADYLGVGRRTAERLLKKFATHGYLSTVGEEMPYTKGRPRAVYELKLSVKVMEN